MLRLIVFLALDLLAASAYAIDIPITARSLTITDKTASGGAAKLSFAARDAAIAKGAGIDVDAISVDMDVRWYRVDGGFRIPAGARAAGAPSGWVENDVKAAKYVNATADSGLPTTVKTATILNGKSAKLIARSAGDRLINLSATPPSFGVQVMFTITNGAEVFRHCTVFPPEEVQLRVLARGGRKLIAKRGTKRACADDSLQVAPLPSLPAAPLAPHLWFDGSDPDAVTALVERATAPATSAAFNAIRAAVDGALDDLAGASDDTRAMAAKGAGLLHVVGATPPLDSGFSSYRDAVVSAIANMSDRTALDTSDEFFTPPPNLLDVLRDAGRLQSIAEAYDLVRGSGIDASADNAMTTRIANWADEYLLDWNLVGDPFGLFPGHRDNWAIKGGSAVITAALAMPEHPHAADWLAAGVSWINESLAQVVKAPGWYGEGAHYANYSLNNLVSAAWHLRNAAGVDWFDDLQPLVAMALALRQPNGQQPPFEEGVSNTFPWDVLLAAYPTLASTMQWALDNSPGDFTNYDNQQFHAVTRFLLHTEVSAVAPSDPPTQFIDGDTHAVVLRSSWGADALQLTGLTALDTSNSELVSSRHNMENPLDLVVHGAGELLLPTASGGPTVTTSPDRAYFLQPAAKNIPLIDGNAPYILDPLAVLLEDQIDSRDAGITRHRLLDGATTTVVSYAAGVNVARTVAMVDDDYGVVVDRFVGTAAHDYALTWRGRGTATLRTAAAHHVAADYQWPSTATGAHLNIDTTSASALSGSLGAGWYAPAFGSEESLSPLSVSTNSAEATFLSVLRPHPYDSAAAVFAPLTVATGAAATVTQGSISDLLIAGASTARVTTDARLALLRTTGGNLTGMAGLHATDLTQGATRIRSDVTASFAATFVAGRSVITVGLTQPGAVKLTLTALPGLGAAGHDLLFNEAPLAAGSVVDNGSTLIVTLPGPGSLVISDS